MGRFLASLISGFGAQSISKGSDKTKYKFIETVWLYWIQYADVVATIPHSHGPPTD
jgi:hypothetical protein